MPRFLPETFTLPPRLPASDFPRAGRMVRPGDEDRIDRIQLMACAVIAQKYSQRGRLPEAETAQMPA